MPFRLTALRFWLVLFSLCITSIIYAQQKTIKGQVKDATNQPVSGASVLVKGTNQGTTTDEAGRFSINVPGNQSVLVISSVGFDAKEVTVGAASNLDVTMTSALGSLNEIVVTGYSTQQRKNITGAVTSVKGEKLQSVQSGNVEQQFQGRAPGVVVITSGQPGTPSQVRIRGFSSFVDNSPLYIIDGVPAFTTEHLAANDIETTTILKDAAAASIYGARAAAGVILITTKKERPQIKPTLATTCRMGGPFPEMDWTSSHPRNRPT